MRKQQDESIWYYDPLSVHHLETLESRRFALPLVDPSLQTTAPRRQEERDAAVILRTKNSEEILAQTMKALQAQTIRPREILVADCESRDRSVEIARHFGAEVTTIPAEEYLPGRVLNQMAEKARARLLVFLNSDCPMLTPTTLESLLEPLERKEVAAAFARQIPRPDAEIWVRRDYRVSFPEEGEAPRWMHLSLCLAAMRREELIKRPFYEAAWGSEDMEWGVAAKKQGKEIAYVPDAVVMHSHNYTLKQLYGRRFIEGEADAFIYQDQYTMPHLIADICKSTLRDCIEYGRSGAFREMGAILPRRTVYYWSYWKGHRHGQARMRANIEDPSTGQKVVLSRYE